MLATMLPASAPILLLALRKPAAVVRLSVVGKLSVVSVGDFYSLFFCGDGKCYLSPKPPFCKGGLSLRSIIIRYFSFRWLGHFSVAVAVATVATVAPLQQVQQCNNATTQQMQQE